MKKLILIFVVTFVSATVQGQHSAVVVNALTDPAGGQQAPGDTTQRIAPRDMESTRSYQQEAITIRTFDSLEWKAIIGDTRYQETDNADTPSAPLSMPWAGPVLKVIAYLVIAGAICWLLYYLIRNTTLALKIERTSVYVGDPGSEVENIDALDVETLLEQARRVGDFRLAVRFYYLTLLKKLNARGLIGWKKDKTNRDYLAELFLKDFHYKEIHRLTNLYESVWYGEHSLKAAAFEQLSDAFENAYSKINTAGQS